MFSTEKKLLSALCASVFALSTMAAVTTVVSQPFTTTTMDLSTIKGETAGTWTGQGEVKAATGSYSGTLPISSSLANALTVEGYVSCATGISETGKPSSVDMMIQIAKPDEDLALPSSETTSDIQIAIGVDKDGSLKVYCKDKSGQPGWKLVKSDLEEGSWHRVGFIFDYVRGTCNIKLDGVALATEYGYPTADADVAATTSGAWYKLNGSPSKLASVKVVGSTAIDELLVKYDSEAEQPVPADSGTVQVAVPNSWMMEQGVTDSSALAPDGSGLKNADKYAAGMGVMDGKTYAISAMSMAGKAGSVKVTLTVPTMTPPANRKNVIKYGAAPDALMSTADIAAGATSVVLDVAPAESGVTKIYYKMENVAK